MPGLFGGADAGRGKPPPEGGAGRADKGKSEVPSNEPVRANERVCGLAKSELAARSVPRSVGLPRGVARRGE